MNRLPAQPSRLKLVGLIFTCVGIGLFGTYFLWLITRINRPVDIPVSMTVGHVRTPVFKVNRNALYDIEIEVEKKIPFETLNCLLGTTMATRSTDLVECPDKPSVVKISWVLMSNGETVARGSTDEYRSGAWRNDSISRELGTFTSESGRYYLLDVDVLADGSSLAPGNPHLKVEVSPAVYEDEAVGGAILFLLCIVLVLMGVVLLLVWFFRNRRTRLMSPDVMAGP